MWDGHGRTDLDNEVEVSSIVIAAGGSVAPCDELAVNLCCDGDVLADRDAEDVVGSWKPETISETTRSVSCMPNRRGSRYSQSSVWRDNDFLNQGEVLVLLGIQDGLPLCNAVRDYGQHPSIVKRVRSLTSTRQP